MNKPCIRERSNFPSEGLNGFLSLGSYTKRSKPQRLKAAYAMRELCGWRYF